MVAMTGPGGRDGGELDGFHVGWVPAAAGDMVSDFASEWEDVTFATRVWERAVEDGYQVDLRVHVLRGDRLAGLAELRDYLAEYHERDPVDWPLTGFDHGQGAGFVGDGEAFWLVEPGLAVDVLVDVERFGADAARVVAASVVTTG